MVGRAGACALLCLLVPAAPARAAVFDDLKEAYAVCLRSEAGPGRRPAGGGIAPALRACAAEGERLERADPRRLRDGYGVSPSSWQVIEGLFGAGNRRGLAGLLR